MTEQEMAQLIFNALKDDWSIVQCSREGDLTGVTIDGDFDLLELARIILRAIEPAI